jgi:predicted alpha/beta-hydrolase family hydrolase
MTTLELDTPQGLARAHLHLAGAPRGALMLGHGAGGSVTAPDLQAVTAAAGELGVSVVLVEQPYRVAGKRSASPAPKLDVAWLSVAEQLAAGPLADLPIVVGGRSSGARVACRTAAESGAAGVLCLAFPLHPPRRSPDVPLKTRLPELDAVTVPALVVQGVNDRFGMPPEVPGRRVVQVAGDHALKKDLDGIAAAVGDWLPTVLG